ncbi:MAG TPA: transglutaminase domain-containing protein [Mycobacteriales bacterium]|nr:transglutaminase domain-containing protein [Mycobacteriales bacterium]
MRTSSIDYTVPAPMTALRPKQRAYVDGLPANPVAICTAVNGALIHPVEMSQRGVPADRLPEKDIRSAADILDLVLERGPLDRPRADEQRVVGTCRHYAVLAVALARARGIAMRARAGFATYFHSGFAVDHWVVEYRQERWIRIDPMVVGGSAVPRPDDLAPEEFLTGGEAWVRYRAGADPATFGVWGTDHAWGVGEIRGNAIRDLAALVRVETLPWDEWGRMTASYEGRTDAAYDELMDRIAAVTGGDDNAAILGLYAAADLAAPPEFLG